jgi:hypothetical protein
MDLNEKEVKDGMTWLYAAGACAIALSVFLQVVDHKLTTSDREIKLEKTLRDLRTAQAALGTEVEDRRFDSQPMYREPIVLHTAANHKKEASHLSHDSHGDHGH